ncbi:hypothetical protein PATSB16_18690 [Pandoraea thiooxydans]|uniref:PAS domain-containing protein n=1 Tax=Pandoraea thiooxydans TaxID=445709 RepID=A0A0G3EPQ1_9BURK|nr:PAS domain-containing protein [Pandoraea thiooxydans]AKJ67984.1 hypothetical protein ABW99_06920 [Pandoraea thiooxydans]APR95209.1 hypothetical protein PATSB16_18690 [Pandoraea thiooxydans]
MNTADLHNQLQLRSRAMAYLEDGTALPTNGGAVSAGTLALLHQLANDPAYAGDVLKILHELQVFQVELDIQHEQMEQDARELTLALNRYVELYAHAPVGYLILDSDYVILEANFMAGEILGVAHDALLGQRIDIFFAPGSRLPLLTLLSSLLADQEPGHFRKASRAVQSGTSILQAVASVAPQSGALLLTMTDSVT